MAADFLASYFGDRKIEAGFFWDTIVAGSLVDYCGVRNIIVGGSSALLPTNPSLT